MSNGVQTDEAIRPVKPAGSCTRNLMSVRNVERSEVGVGMLPPINLARWSAEAAVEGSGKVCHSTRSKLATCGPEVCRRPFRGTSHWNF